MKRLTLALLLFALTAIAEQFAGAAPIKRDEIDHQNYAFKQWYGTTLIWKFDRLPQQASVRSQRIPYSGHIYPDSQGGTTSLMRKYDQAFNQGSEAAVFEWRDALRNGHISWAGHCNGWTSAAIRHAEPQNSVIRNGVKFTPADIKGLLAELYGYSDTEFLGGVDAAINPGTLHVVLSNWIGRGRHPLGMESSVGHEVWNYPAFSYSSDSKMHDDTHVEVKLNVGYANFLDYEVNAAPKRFRHRSFHYMLTLNDDGEIIDGTYSRESDRIDMLWIPLKPTQGGTEGNEKGNPHIDPDEVLGIWRESVPAATRSAWFVADPMPEDAISEPETEPTVEDSLPELALEIVDVPNSVVIDDVASATLEPIDSGEFPTIADTNSSEENADVRGTEVFEERFPDGTIKVSREVTLDEDLNYVNSGMYRAWNEAETLVAIGRFEMGQRVGPWKRLLRVSESDTFSREPFVRFSEPFVSEANFQGGKLHGKWTIHDSKDRRAAEFEFAEGRRNGKRTYFFPSGAKLREADYRDGLINGLYQEFAEDGTTVLELKYTAGCRCSINLEKYISTTKKAETSLLHPPLKLAKPDDWWNCEFAQFKEDGNPINHGPVRGWYENGNARNRGNYVNGEAMGEFVWWLPNGQISRKGSFLDGQAHGQWSWWHSNGGKSVQGDYQNGKPVGRWLYWKPNGQLAQSKIMPADATPADTEVDSDLHPNTTTTADRRR